MSNVKILSIFSWNLLAEIKQVHEQWSSSNAYKILNDYNRRLELYVKIILKSQCDVILLQEVDNKTLNHLQLKLDPYIKCITHSVNDQITGTGTAIFAKANIFKIIQCKNISLSQDNSEKTTMAIVQLFYDKSYILLCSSHLNSGKTKKDETNRINEVERLSNYLEQFAYYSGIEYDIQDESEYPPGKSLYSNFKEKKEKNQMIL
jgi:exonuclease III